MNVFSNRELEGSSQPGSQQQLPTWTNIRTTVCRLTMCLPAPSDPQGHCCKCDALYLQVAHHAQCRPSYFPDNILNGDLRRINASVNLKGECECD